MVPFLELHGLKKAFGSTCALDGVSLSVAAGEVLALLGENGAGKSTLVQIVGGLVAPDAGEVRIRGERLSIRSPREARRLGIGLVHQHFSLAPGLSVAESFALDEGGARLWRFSRKSAAARVRALADELGFALDPDAGVAELSVGDQQRLEILKALKPLGRSSSEPLGLLILDEPTAALTPGESGELFRVVARLRALGHALLFITHRLPEVMAIADRVVVLRAGRTVLERRVADTSAVDLARCMMGDGREASAPPRAPEPQARVRLELHALVAGDARGPGLVDASLRLRQGDICGVAGVDGNGQRELAEAVLGAEPVRSGWIAIDGKRVERWTPRRARDAGLAYIPGDRLRHGLVAELSLEDNLLLSHFRRPELGARWFFGLQQSRAFAREQIALHGIRPAAPEALAGRLSGGNQQRLLLARELAFGASIVVAVNPSRGLDLQATRFVHSRLRAAASAGAAILLISVDLDEVLALATCIAVLTRGRLRLTEARDRAAIGRLMAGAR